MIVFILVKSMVVSTSMKCDNSKLVTIKRSNPNKAMGIQPMCYTLNNHHKLLCNQMSSD